MRKLVLVVVLSLVVLLTEVARAAPPTFYYVVTAVDINGFESFYSLEVSATFLKVPATPPATGLYQQHIADLTWIAPLIPTGGAAIAGYNVYRASTTGGPYTQINAALVTGTLYTDSFTLPNAPSGLAKTLR